MQRLLIIEDEFAMRTALTDCLTAAGYRVLAAADGEAGLARAVSDKPDLILLDVMMPKLDGFGLCTELRRLEIPTPVLMLTAKGQVEDRVAGLDAGADDYLVKPFSTAELVARVRALLRRRRDLSSLSSTRYADLVLDHATREVRRGTRPVALTRREFDLLALFMANPEAAITRARLVGEAWGGEPDPPGTASVDVYVGYLRRKLEERGEPRLLHTVRGVGYQLRMPPEGGAPAG